MTQAERIREYYRDHPTASYDEVAEVVGTANNNVRANLAKDIKAGRCVRLKDKSQTTHLTLVKQKNSLN